MMPWANIKGKTLEGREQPFVHVWCYRVCETRTGLEGSRLGAKLARYSNCAYRPTSEARVSGITTRMLTPFGREMPQGILNGADRNFYGGLTPLDAPGVLGVECKAFGGQVLAAVSGFRHAFTA